MAADNFSSTSATSMDGSLIDPSAEIRDHWATASLSVGMIPFLLFASAKSDWREKVTVASRDDDNLFRLNNLRPINLFTLS